MSPSRPRPRADVGALDTAAAVLGGRAGRDVALGPLTTYRVGGPASLLFEAEDVADLDLAARAVQRSRLPVLVVGRGSNLLVADQGFAGLALVLGEGFAGIEVSGISVIAGGRASLPVLARRTAAAGLRGLEWAVGVPGSVGGAVRMNAGGHGSQTSNRLVGARVLDLEAGGDRRDHVVAMSPADLGLGYRTSSLSSTQVVVSAEFRLDLGSRDEAEREIDEIVRWRRLNQPGGANAGSVFKNPPGDSAGRLIEAAGMKGHSRGSASVSSKHANFFQSAPGGSAADVVSLIGEVRAEVERRSGVRLETEVQLVGFEPSTLEVS